MMEEKKLSKYTLEGRVVCVLVQLQPSTTGQEGGDRMAESAACARCRNR